MDPAAAPLAFIGMMELVVIGVIGLLLFGGDLPKVMADLGRIWVKLRRAVNEFKRESGIDEAVRDIKRETELRLEEPRWRREMDHAAGPARSEEPVETKLDPAAPAAPAPAAAAPASEEAPAAEPPRTPDSGPTER
jgi:Sec-independent protein translocase protein TatA